MNLIDMWDQMGLVARIVAFILVFMSMWSFGVAIERYYTFSQARKQSKLYAPQVAKHLKEGRLKDALAVSQAKTYQYSHLAKVVLAGLQEYQFQQDAGGALNRDDIVDTVRRAIQRATALTSNDLKKGIPSLATIGATAPFVGLLGTVVGIINAFHGIGVAGLRRSRRRLGRYFRSARSRPRSAWSSRSRPCGCTTTSPAGSSTSTSRWTTRRRSSWTTSSRRRRRGPQVPRFRGSEVQVRTANRRP